MRYVGFVSKQVIWSRSDSPSVLSPSLLWKRVRKRGLLRQSLVLFACLATGPGCAVIATAQDDRADTPADSWHFRYDLFQMLIEERGLQVLPATEQALSTPDDSLIVIVGDPRRLLSAGNWKGLTRFVQSGGALLLASDRSFELPGFGQYWEGPVTDTRSEGQYQDFVDCLRIPPRSDAGLAGVSQLVTNRSGWFAPRAAGWAEWEVVASFPGNCQPVAARQQSLIAVGRSRENSSGLVVVSADASLFTNGMLWHGDNAIAAIRITELICDATRSQVAFVIDGQAQGTYRDRTAPSPAAAAAPPLSTREPPRPELDDLVQLANVVAREIAEANVVNEALSQQPRNVDPARYYQGIWLVVALLLLCGTLWLLFSGGTLRTAVRPSRRMRAAYELQKPVDGDAGDYRHAAGYLAREFCLEITGSRHSSDWQSYLASSSATSSSLVEAERQNLSRVIDIACRGYHAKLSAREFQQLGQTIATLRATRLEHSSTPSTAHRASL